MLSKPVVVVGDGWAALGSVGFLVQAGQQVCWVKGSGARMLSPTPSVEIGAGGGLSLQAWVNLAKGFGIELSEPVRGCFLREFRNKAFREPIWIKAPTPEARAEVRRENLWAPETRIAPAFEARFEWTVGEIEEKIRTHLLTAGLANLRRVEDLPVLSVTMEGEEVKSVTLGSGETIECQALIYADRWSSIREIQGLPAPLQKAVATSRRREPVGVLQATFQHSSPLALGVNEGFYSVLNKEAGEEFDRRVWGYFSSDGMRSCWTLCLAREEVEDNHEIAKKLRRMKAALDKMFVGSSWLPQDKPEFMSSVHSEHVRFEEAFLFSGSTLEEVSSEINTHSKKALNVDFITDAFGPSLALHQVALRFDAARVALAAETSEGANAETENVDLPGPVETQD